MGQSLRIRSKLGINQTLNVPLDQEYEFLEILSLKILQADIYTRSCAEYGVIVGRVTANNGFGIPNAKISVFIPIQNEDLNNPLITSVYPYTVPTDKNDDGYRYNLLPYEKSYSKHAATGTFPTRLDALTDSTVIELVDKYYKFTVRTNDSGDYMIMGVPTGFQTLVMDVDLSDIGEFSLTPQDLIRMGLATESQVAGNQFKTSEDLESLPQIINITKTIEVSPLWGEPDICQIAINRVDFDLRDDANVDIQPTAVFMGSMFSTTENLRLRKNCKPRDNMGNLCNLVAGPGQILAIRSTINQDSEGNPILEQYELEQSGNVIDEDGTWLVEIPMNLDYIVTNEFGERVISPDSSVGIPSKGNYRFKIKWQQPKDLTQQTRRAYFLVPNIREFGWTSSFDPNYISTTSIQGRQLASSYYFGLDWSGYTDGLTTTVDKNTKVDEIVNCEDTFYSFGFNRVYTVSGLIDQYKNGANRGRFIGIKEIDDDDCSSTTNKFPVNDGVRNFDSIFFVVSILLQIIQLIGVPILIVLHFVAWIWNEILVPFKWLFSALWAFQVAWYTAKAIGGFVSGAIKNSGCIACLIANVATFGVITPICGPICADATQTTAEAWGDLANAGKWLLAGISFEYAMRKTNKQPFPPIKLTSITYPNCQTCQCSGYDSNGGFGSYGGGNLTNFDNPIDYWDNISTKTVISNFNSDDIQLATIAFSQAVGTRTDSISDKAIYKTMESQELVYTSNNNRFFNYSLDLPFAERMNIFNLRKKYFDEVNKISVTFNSPYNSVNHFDNTITIISKTPFETGTLFTFVDPATTQDVNYRELGISGITLNAGPSTYNVEYATSQTTNGTVSYILNTGSTTTNYKFPSDVEYYQVLTAITISDASTIWQNTNESLLPGLLNSSTIVNYNERTDFISGWGSVKQYPSYKVRDLFTDFDNQYIVILQRGVDPYSPKYINKYGIGKILGFPTEDSVIITGNTRLNIPIQKLNNTTASVQLFNNQDNIFYPSHFFRAGNDFSGFTTNRVGYYGGLDATNISPESSVYLNRPTIGSVRATVSSPSNGAFDIFSNQARYDLSEDLSGGAYYWVESGNKPSNTKIVYYTSVLLPSLTANPMSISSKINNVLRTDRLPSSDYLDGSSWNYNPSLLQQNIGFTFYEINSDSDSITVQGYGSGASIVSPDISGLTASQNVFNTFECENMVSLSCYSGDSTTFGVKTGCPDSDSVENGCYVIMKKPLVDLFNGKDLKAWSEWGYRFRFFYGLCRGVLSQTFVNNWVNGTLYAYPIQVDTYYNKQNKPTAPVFCKDTIYFDSKTNNFYYRSSPYNNTTNKFVGKSVATQVQPVNKSLLQYPTTIMNLGWKDSFYSEINFDPSTNSYVINQLNSTSYSDTSDLINLFVVSRITDENFIQRITSGFNPDNSLDQLFSRPEKRIDGDLAQMMSINSEEGVIKFSPEYYALTGSQYEPVIIDNPISSNPTIGVFFSSTTENLQFKDFLSPGRIDFRATPTSNFTPFSYGIKSQEVPYFKWELENSPTIFGTELNNWATSQSQIGQSRYQSLDRTTSTYYQGQGIVNDQNKRGYIFKVSNDSTLVAGTQYDKSRTNENNIFLVGAPFHFYFGLNQGATALNKFKTKYALDE
jgi:hypothetical protein